MSNFITFIIPSSNRQSLVAALDSLMEQTNDEWEALVILDGKHRDFKISKKYTKIRLINIQATGHAGLVRNAGFPLVTSNSFYHFEKRWLFRTTTGPNCGIKLRRYFFCC